MKTVWESIYEKGEFLQIDPHPEIDGVLDLFRKNGVKRILDLGSGGGRHLLRLAGAGFESYGLDHSPTGLAFSIMEMARRGLTGHFCLHDILDFPYEDGYFDSVISIQVIHHNGLEKIRRTIGEIARVLKKGGWIWVTMPVSKNEPSTSQKEMEPGTFVPLDGPEKGLPHHYFKEEEIPQLFAAFSIMDLHVDPLNHFSLTARKSSES